MGLGTRSDLNSFIGDADNLERRLPHFRIYVLGGINYFGKIIPF